MPAISVIIPTWNRAATLGRAIESALSQSLRPTEILVCDDGSTDDSAHLVATYGDDVVRWLPGPRGGRPAIPRNRGLRNARGEWIAFLDSDDVWLPQKLERQMAAIGASGLRASCAAAVRIFPDGREVGLLGIHDASTIGFSELVKRNQVVCSSVVLHRDVLAMSGDFPESSALKVGEDYALWLRVVTQTAFAYVDAPLVNYADDEANSVRADAPDGWTQRMRVLDDMIAWSRGRSLPRSVIYRLLWERRVAGFRKSIFPAARHLRPLANAWRRN